MENKEIRTIDTPVVPQWVMQPLNTFKALTTKTMQEAVSSQSLSIWGISSVDQMAAKSILVLFISEMIQFLNVGKSMNEFQINQTADLLLNDVEGKNMKPEDYRVMFDNAKKGIYGSLYDRIDGQLIFEWKSQYWANRAEYCENNNISLHGKKLKDPIQILPEVLEALKATLNSKIEPSYEEKRGYIRAKTPRDIFIQDCFTEFDKLFRQNPIERKGRFIEFENKIVDQIEYTSLKTERYDEENTKQN